MAFIGNALKERLESGEISDPHTYIELYAEAYDEVDDEDAALAIADHLYDDLPPDTEEDSQEDLDNKQVADTLALTDFINDQTEEDEE